MKKFELLFLFVILVLGILLCSFLGGNCGKEGFEINTYTGVNSLPPVTTSSGTPDLGTGNTPNGLYLSSMAYDNYNHYNGSSIPTLFYGQNGATAKVVNSGNVYSIIVTNSSGSSITYSATPPSNSNSAPGSVTKATYYGPNGGKATIINFNGQQALELVDNNGNITIFTSTNQQTYNPSYDNPTPSSSSNISAGSIYSNSNSNSNSGYDSDNEYYNSSSSSSSSNQNGAYNSALPKGIPGRMIPPGSEDLYILKSEVVPPVCPACPTSAACPRKEKCPPCPACARCPEPSFECKKVPNYNSINEEYLPVPVLNNFSGFGM
jgi:hypothetical protein